MDKKTFWLYVTSMWLSLRVVVFENYTTVITYTWWLFTFIVAVAAHFIFFGSEVGVIVFALVFQKYVYVSMKKVKSKLIMRGDIVEFASDQDEGYVQHFKNAIVLRKMYAKDVKTTRLFSEALLPLYSHFYLVKLEDENAIIPYEWIVGLEIESLLEVD